MSNELNISDLLNSKVLKPQRINKTVEKRRQTALTIATCQTIGTTEKTSADEIASEITSGYRLFNDSVRKFEAVIEAIQTAQQEGKDIYQAIGDLMKSTKLLYSNDKYLAKAIVEAYELAEHNKALKTLEYDLLTFKHQLLQYRELKDLYPNELLENIEKNGHHPNTELIYDAISRNGFPFFSPQEEGERNKNLLPSPKKEQ